MKPTLSLSDKVTSSQEPKQSAFVIPYGEETSLSFLLFGNPKMLEQLLCGFAFKQLRASDQLLLVKVKDDCHKVQESTTVDTEGTQTG